MLHYQIAINGEMLDSWLWMIDELGFRPEECLFDVHLDIDPEDYGVVEAVVRVPEGSGDRGPKKEYAPVEVMRAIDKEEI